ncbi:hypothetical protein C0992_000767 [Termitomyces sp. T32_za158]|nr:hypothetical protein C0992_000767 [Termitomyces sp. T32_za158]
MSIHTPSQPISHESRSAQLLRTTLLRDDAASSSSSSSSSSSAAGHRRRHSHDEELVRGSFLFRSPMSPSPYVRSKRTHSPPPGCTPARKRQSLPPPMTPPELALRQRLERVLSANAARDASPPSPPSLPRTPRTHANTLPSTPRRPPHLVLGDDPAKPTCSPMPTPPPTPPHALGRTRAHVLASPSSSSSPRTPRSPSSSLRSTSDDSIPDLALPPLLPASPSSAPPHPHAYTQHHPRFNARKASESLRHASGYVSFASVEGLGGPPGTPVGDDCDGEDEEARAAGGAAFLVDKGRAWMGWVFGQGGSA